MQLVLLVLAAALAAAASDPAVLIGRTYFVKAIDFDDAAPYYTVRHTWRRFPLRVRSGTAARVQLTVLCVCVCVCLGEP